MRFCSARALFRLCIFHHFVFICASIYILVRGISTSLLIIFGLRLYIYELVIACDFINYFKTLDAYFSTSPVSSQTQIE